MWFLVKEKFIYIYDVDLVVFSLLIRKNKIVGVYFVFLRVFGMLFFDWILWWFNL